MTALLIAIASLETRCFAQMILLDAERCESNGAFKFVLTLQSLDSNDSLTLNLKWVFMKSFL